MGSLEHPKQGIPLRISPNVERKRPKDDTLLPQDETLLPAYMSLCMKNKVAYSHYLESMAYTTSRAFCDN